MIRCWEIDAANEATAYGDVTEMSVWSESECLGDLGRVWVHAGESKLSHVIERVDQRDSLLPE